MIKPVLRAKMSKEEIQELAGQTVKKLESDVKTYNTDINFIQAKIEDCERKIRWLKRELID